MQLTLTVCNLTQGFPREEQFGLTSQIRRAAVSIPSNIPEGRGRLNPAEFRQFLAIARGSNCELQTQLELARALNYGSPALIKKTEALSNEVRKMLFGMLSAISPERAGVHRGNRGLKAMNSEL